MTDQTAKLFTIGGSQAVRIPKNLKLPGEIVAIRRSGRALVIEPVGGRDWQWLDELTPADADFMSDARDTRNQERKALDDLFR